MYTREQIEAAVKAKGYVWFEDTANKGYDVNIVGIRNLATGKAVTNEFKILNNLEQNIDNIEVNKDAEH
jgi:hypothetical protein